MANNLRGMDGTIARLEDRSAVESTVALLAQHSDARRLDDYLALFRADAVFEIEGRTRQDGLAAIRAARAPRMAEPTLRRHLVFPFRMDLNGDGAVVESHFLLVEGDGTLALRSTGRYVDHLQRTGDGWKIARHTVFSDASA